MRGPQTRRLISGTVWRSTSACSQPVDVVHSHPLLRVRLPSATAPPVRTAPFTPSRLRRFAAAAAASPTPIMMKGIEDDEGPESSLRKLTQTFGVLGYVVLNKSGEWRRNDCDTRATPRRAD